MENSSYRTNAINQVKPEPSFTLYVKDTNITTGSIAVSWSLNKEALELLAEKDIKDPWVVLCIEPTGSNDSSKEIRKLVPVQDLIAYLEFRVPGANNICGFIVASEKHGEKFIFRSSNFNKTYDINIINSYEKIYHRSSDIYTNCQNYSDNNCCIRLVAPFLKVEIPVEAFANEPSEWEKIWINYFIPYRFVNQCNLRRRRLFAYTFQPIILLFDVLFRLLLTICSLLIGDKRFNLRYLLHPLTYSIDSLEMIFGGGTIYFKYKYIPLTLLSLFIVMIIFDISKNNVIGTLFGVCIFAVTIGIIFCAAKILIYSENYLSKNKPKSAWYLKPKEMNLITENKTPIFFNHFPSNHKTIRLHFENLKSKVCRPFQR